MKKPITAFGLILFFLMSSIHVSAQDDYLGDIKITAINFDQRNWMPCEGQLLSISENTALFSLIGTIYGGNGVTNFALPDLRGRVPIGIGTGPGQPTITQGVQGGSSTNYITTTNLPAHSHQVYGVLEDGNSASPTNSFPAGTKILDKEYATTGTLTSMNSGMLSNTGGNQPINNMQPYLGVRYVICVAGIYPQRP